MNGYVHEFAQSSQQDEVHLARRLISKREQNSISIYDRLHCGYETFLEHQRHGSFFIVRARVGLSTSSSGKGVHLEVQDFLRSKDRSRWVLWKPARGFIRKKPKVYVRLVKVRNRKTQEDNIFVTNLPDVHWGRQEIADLYARRWDIETNFKELTYILKMGQFHSKNLNGILQEIYALLWLTNAQRFCMQQVAQAPSSDLMEKTYVKSNFKLGIRCLLDHYILLLKKHWKLFWRLIEGWIRRLGQRRQRRSRAYARVVKHRGREYQLANTVPRRLY